MRGKGKRKQTPAGHSSEQPAQKAKKARNTRNLGQIFADNTEQSRSTKEGEVAVSAGQEEIHILSPHFGEYTSNTVNATSSKASANANSITTLPVASVSSTSSLHNAPNTLFGPGDELGAHVPETMKQKIRNREYVNLRLLLKGNTELNNLVNASSIQFIDGQLQLTSNPKTLNERCNSIDQWTNAFLIYGAIFIQAHPDSALAVFKYMHDIRQAARRGGFGWRLYDEQFRIRLQHQPSLSFACFNSELYIRCMIPANYGHNAPEALPPKNIPNPVCYDYNRGVCARKSCKYSHTCSICKANHPKSVCPGARNFRPQHFPSGNRVPTTNTINHRQNTDKNKSA